LSSIIFDMAGKKNPRKLAEYILKSGKAEKKFREIVGAQGGDPFGHIKSSTEEELSACDHKGIKRRKDQPCVHMAPRGNVKETLAKQIPSHGKVGDGIGREMPDALVYEVGYRIQSDNYRSANEIQMPALGYKMVFTNSHITSP